MSSQDASASRASWSSVAERGSLLGLRFLVWSYRGVGRRITGWLLYPTVAYFVIAAGPARRASLRYLQHVHEFGNPALPRPPGMREVFRHFLTFAELTLDRFCFWAGRYEQFEVHKHGIERFEEDFEQGRGAVLVGAHLGSFDVLRVLARAIRAPVNAVMFTDNAEQINTIFKHLDPESELRVIEMDPGSVTSAFEIKRCLDRGEIVALLGDRAAPGGRGRQSEVSLLGHTTALSDGPFLLSPLLGSPIYLSLALRTGKRRYELFFEPLGHGERVPAAERRGAVRALMETYAKQLERYCMREPFQWFNFYDYWGEDIEKAS